MRFLQWLMILCILRSASESVVLPGFIDRATKLLMCWPSLQNIIGFKEIGFVIFLCNCALLWRRRGKVFSGEGSRDTLKLCFMSSSHQGEELRSCQVAAAMLFGFSVEQYFSVQVWGSLADGLGGLVFVLFSFLLPVLLG